jgi:hypothetical protein
LNTPYRSNQVMWRVKLYLSLKNKHIPTLINIENSSNNRTKSQNIIFTVWINWKRSRIYAKFTTLPLCPLQVLVWCLLGVLLGCVQGRPPVKYAFVLLMFILVILKRFFQMECDTLIAILRALALIFNVKWANVKEGNMLNKYHYFFVFGTKEQTYSYINQYCKCLK